MVEPALDRNIEIDIDSIDDMDVITIVCDSDHTKPKPIFRHNRSANVETDRANETNQSCETYKILNIKDIEESIPKSASSTRLSPIPPNVTEWRWRFFQIGQRKLIEISLYENNIRSYIDYNGNVITYDLDPSWDAFVTKTLYAYFRT